VLVLLPAGGRVHLVSAEHEKPPAGEGGGILRQRELGSGQQPGHGVGRVEAVPQVGDEVDEGAEILGGLRGEDRESMKNENRKSKTENRAERVALSMRRRFTKVPLRLPRSRIT
jgi:hypothetical protein